jgi:hypothetical protein
MAQQRVWVPLGGTSRRYQNRRTGEIISRRQYDKRYGLLRRQGFRSYEAKAKAFKQRDPVPALLRPAPGRRAVPVVRTLDDFKKAWSKTVQATRKTKHVYVLFAKAKKWQQKLIDHSGHPDIVVEIRMGFPGAMFDNSVITPYLRFLTQWGIRHYRQYLSRKGKRGDRVGMWVGYDFPTATGVAEVISTPVPEQPLSNLSGTQFPIDEQVTLFFVAMVYADPKVRGVLLRILRRR